jgi:phage gp46-like protein
MMRDYRLDISRGAIIDQKDGDAIFNCVYTSLMTRRGMRIDAPQFGSRIHTVAKLTDKNMELIRDYCREATAWIVKLGKARSIDFEVRRDGDRCVCVVLVLKNGSNDPSNYSISFTPGVA